MERKNSGSKVPRRKPARGPGQTAPSAPPGPADAAAVGRALRVLRDLLDGMAPGEGPGRFTIVLVDDLLPVLDDALALLEAPGATPRPTGGPSAAGP